VFTYIKAAIASPKNPFTETDGSWCLKRIMATLAGIEMLYKFGMLDKPDFQNFAVGMGAIFTALAIVNYSERSDKPKEIPHA